MRQALRPRDERGRPGEWLCLGLGGAEGAARRLRIPEPRVERGNFEPVAALPGRDDRFHRPCARQGQAFVTATNVYTGRRRVFRNAEITPEVLLASAFLLTMFQAIEIDGERTSKRHAPRVSLPL